MSEQLDAARQFGASLDEQRWSGGIRIVVEGSMRAPMHDGKISLEAGWRADVFTEGSRQRKPTFTFVAESPAELFRDLAALAAGELDVPTEGVAPK